MSYTNVMHRLAKGQWIGDWISKATNEDLYDAAAYDVDERVQSDARRELIARETELIDERIAARGGSQ